MPNMSLKVARVMNVLRRASVRVGIKGQQSVDLKVEELYTQRLWSVGSPHAQLAVQRCRR
jgi:hypothetical protein